MGNESLGDMNWFGIVLKGGDNGLKIGRAKERKTKRIKKKHSSGEFIANKTNIPHPSGSPGVLTKGNKPELSVKPEPHNEKPNTGQINGQKGPGQKYKTSRRTINGHTGNQRNAALTIIPKESRKNGPDLENLIGVLIRK